LEDGSKKDEIGGLAAGSVNGGDLDGEVVDYAFGACALAGLLEKWKDRNAGSELLTFTIITTNPNEVVQPMHDRMPVIIPEHS